jgi:hypothetical protein
MVTSTVGHLLIYREQIICLMKSLMKTLVGFVKKEWFLLVMVCAITMLVILFEVF